MKKYENGQDILKGEWTLERRGDEVVADLAMRFKFKIDRSQADTWGYFSDFNLWQQDLQYSNVIGESAEGSVLYLTIKDRDYYKRHYGLDGYRKVLTVRRAVAGNLIVLEELSDDQRKIEAYYTFVLAERARATEILVLMSWAPLWAPKASEEQLRASYQHACCEIEKRYRENYIPRLRKVIEGGSM